MTITTLRKPKLISPVFADNKFTFKSPGVSFFNFKITGDINKEFKVFADNAGQCEFDIRYILEDYIFSQIARPNDYSILPEGMKSYSLTITTSALEVLSVGTFKFFNGALQDREENKAQAGFLMNNVKGGVYLHADDEFTLMVMQNNDIQVLNLIQNSTAIKALTDIHITPRDPRFITKRFAYVNNNGATDYVNFSLATKEKLKIKRQYYNNDNKRELYNIDATQEFTVVSEQMTEEQSENLKYLWVSPLIELLENGKYYTVELLTKSVEVLNNKSKKTLSYAITFKYTSKYNVQK